MAEQPRITFEGMALAGARLIKNCTTQNRMRPQELAIESGVPLDRVELLLYGNYSGQLPSLNGIEWEALISAAEVPLDDWIKEAEPLSKTTDDMLEISAVPVYGAASSYEPSEEAQEHLKLLIGLSTAFYMKASAKVEPPNSI